MKITKYICTYFDYNYLPRGLALYQSIKKFHDDFIFFVLTFDDKAYDYLITVNEINIIPIHHQVYEKYFNTSPEKFKDRKQYYFSTTPNLCLFLINEYPEIDILLYLDSDVYLYNTIDPLYDEFGDNSIGLTPHRVNPLLRLIAKHYGKFNVGVNLFRNSKEGIKCLNDWKNDCESWYPGKPGYPLEFFSDQIFLDYWPEKYDKIKIIENIGVNVVYWNVANFKITKTGDCYFVNDQPLMIFHFSTLRKTGEKEWNTNSSYALASVSGLLLEIFENYIKHIESFGINNKTIVKLHHKEKILKRMAHTILRIFFNEIVLIK